MPGQGEAQKVWNSLQKGSDKVFHRFGQAKVGYGGLN